MRWLLLAPCVVVVWLVWSLFLAIILRPWIRLPLFALWNKEETAGVLRQLKPRSYILLVGVFQWGWPCFFGITLFDYISNRYFGGRVPRLPLYGILESLLVWSLVGIWFGWTMRNSLQRIARDKKPDSVLH